MTSKRCPGMVGMGRGTSRVSRPVQPSRERLRSVGVDVSDGPAGLALDRGPPSITGTWLLGEETRGNGGPRAARGRRRRESLV